MIARTHVRWVPILALIAVSTMISLDRTARIAASFPGSWTDRVTDGPGVLGVFLELRAHDWRHFLVDSNASAY